MSLRIVVTSCNIEVIRRKSMRFHFRKKKYLWSQFFLFFKSKTILEMPGPQIRKNRYRLGASLFLRADLNSASSL